MIVRILGEGQYDLADGSLDALNGLDEQLEAAIESGDEGGDILAAEPDAVRAEGENNEGGRA